jgi:ribonuclease HI
MDAPHAYVFTDGSARDSGVGAWAALIIFPGSGASRLIHGVLSETTVNRCELIPIIEGLRLVANALNAERTPGIRVRVVTDSETTCRTLSREFTPGSNLDLWAAYGQVATNMEVSALWRDRNSHPYMKVVDVVCYALRKSSLDQVARVNELVTKQLVIEKERLDELSGNPE